MVGGRERNEEKDAEEGIGQRRSGNIFLGAAAAARERAGRGRKVTRGASRRGDVAPEIPATHALRQLPVM